MNKLYLLVVILMNKKYGGMSIRKIVFYFLFFLFLQYAYTDWNMMSIYETGKKMIYSILTTVIFLLFSNFLDKWSQKNEKP